VKCQILQECFLQNFNMQKFQNMERSNSRTFRGLSRAWNFFCQNSRTFKDFSRTLWTLYAFKQSSIIVHHNAMHYHAVTTNFIRT